MQKDPFCPYIHTLVTLPCYSFRLFSWQTWLMLSDMVKIWPSPMLHCLDIGANHKAWALPHDWDSDIPVPPIVWHQTTLGILLLNATEIIMARAQWEAEHKWLGGGSLSWHIPFPRITINLFFLLEMQCPCHFLWAELKAQTTLSFFSKLLIILHQ